MNNSMKCVVLFYFLLFILGSSDKTKSPNVLIVTIDRGFDFSRCKQWLEIPTMSYLSQSGVFYPNIVATSSSVISNTISFLTGIHPEAHDTVVFGDYAYLESHFNKPLSRIVSSTYITGIVGHQHLKSKELDKSLYTTPGESPSSLDLGRETNAALKWIEDSDEMIKQRKPDDKVKAWLLHVSFPGIPFDLVNREEFRNCDALNTADIEYIQNLDSSLGRLFTKISLFDSKTTLVVVMALSGPYGRVPLWIHWVGYAPSNQPMVSLMDVFPTLVKAAGYAVPPESHGLSLLSQSFRKGAVYSDAGILELVSPHWTMRYDPISGHSWLFQNSLDEHGWVVKTETNESSVHSIMLRALLRWRSRQDYMPMIWNQMVSRPAEGRNVKLARAAGRPPPPKLNKQGHPRKNRVVDSSYELALRYRGVVAEQDLQLDLSNL